ncbi:hypothetical protein [Psychrobacter sp. WY6]|uniref:hypothetical protein n=1 Tax=Psychrobacter sp. WY6 TaxID=2708350 RepID=UPI002022B87E|nr:hypothetical protein [Psychrobacter sp. WY6]
MNNFSMGLSYAHARSKGEDTGYSFYSQTGSGSDAGDKYMVNLAYQPTDTTELGWRSTYVAPVTQTFIFEVTLRSLRNRAMMSMISL